MKLKINRIINSSSIEEREAESLEQAAAQMKSRKSAANVARSLLISKRRPDNLHLITIIHSSVCVCWESQQQQTSIETSSANRTTVRVSGRPHHWFSSSSSTTFQTTTTAERLLCFSPRAPNLKSN